MENRKENLKRVQEKIYQAAKRAGRNPDEITLLAVSKVFTPKDIEEVYQIGQRDFGEKEDFVCGACGNKIAYFSISAEITPRSIRMCWTCSLATNSTRASPWNLILELSKYFNVASAPEPFPTSSVPDFSFIPAKAGFDSRGDKI